MVTTIHKWGSSEIWYELHRPLVSKPSQLTRVTVCDPMYGCWVCGQDKRPLFILPLILAPPLFIEVSVPSQESEHYVFVLRGVDFAYFYDLFCSVGF
jgi:hypothetical protein